MFMTGEDLVRNAISPVIPNRMVDGIEITETAPDQMVRKPRKKRTMEIPKEIENWTVPHFVTYALRCYRERYGKDWGLNFAAQCNEISMVKDCLVDVFGFCDNEILKQYIKWFFDNCADQAITKSGGFYFSQLRKDWHVKRFAENYKFKPAVQAETKKISQKIVHSVSEQAISDIFLLSDEDFVSEFGVIIPMNWLVLKKGFKRREAAQYVFQACNRLYAKGQFSAVKTATEKFNPYPKSLPFTEADKLAKKINPSLTIDVEMKDDIDGFRAIL